MASFSRFRPALPALAAALLITGCGGEDTLSADTASGEPLPTIEAPEGADWTSTVTVTEAGGYMLGNPEAPIRLTEFASYTCPGCRAFEEQAFESIRDDYVATGRVAFEFRSYLRSPIDLVATMMTQCGNQDSFFVLSDQLFSNQNEIMAGAQALGESYQQIINLPEEERYQVLASSIGLTDFFAQRGVSRDQASACLANAERANELVQQTADATDEYNIPGTPSFLINGQLVRDGSWPELEQRIQQMGAR